MMSSQINFAFSDLARLIGDDVEANASAREYAVGTFREKLDEAHAGDRCAAKGGGGVLTPPTVRKGKDIKGKEGKSGPKRLQG